MVNIAYISVFALSIIYRKMQMIRINQTSLWNIYSALSLEKKLRIHRQKKHYIDNIWDFTIHKCEHKSWPEIQ